MQPAYINYEGVSRMQAAGPTSPPFLSLPPFPFSLSSRAMKFSSCLDPPDLRDTRAHAKPYRSTVPRIFHAEAGAARATKVCKSEKKLSVLDELSPRVGRDVDHEMVRPARSILQLRPSAERPTRRSRDWMMQEGETWMQNWEGNRDTITHHV